MLTEIEIKNVKPKDGKPHKLKDAHGLHLLVTANGSKLWRFRYQFEGRETMLGLGPTVLSLPSMYRWPRLARSAS